MENNFGLLEPPRGKMNLVKTLIMSAPLRGTEGRQWVDALNKDSLTLNLDK